jgi:hypothetical protein
MVAESSTTSTRITGPPTGGCGRAVPPD